MTGSLQVKKGKYYAVINLKSKNGKRNQKWICTGFTVAGNKRKAQDFLNHLLVEYDLKEHIPENGRVKFSGFIQWWLMDKKGKVEMSTWEKYKVCIEKHVAPYFEEKGLILAELSPRHFVEFYNDKFTGGRLDGKPGGLSIASLKGLSLVIKESLNTAVLLEYINRNPALNVPLPRGEEKRQAGNDLPRMRFHDLRHSTASILFDKGWSLKEIQEWLGHADIETTGNIYTHISQIRRHSMAKNIENTFKL